MAFKIADGYVEVHARANRSAITREAKKAADSVENESKSRQGRAMEWLFKVNPKLMRLIEAPLGSIFGSPILFAAGTTFAFALGGIISTAITTALLTGIAGGFVAVAAFANKKALEAPWNRMVNRIEGVFQRASAPITKPLIGAIDMIGDAFEKWEPTLNRIYKMIAPLIEPFTGGVLGFLEAMLPGIERAMPGIQTVVLSLADHLPGLGTAIGDFFATLAEHGPLLERVVGLMITWLENFFKVAGPILLVFMQSFADGADRWNAFTDALKDGMDWLIKAWHALPGLWDDTWGAVSGFFSGLGDDISGFFSGLGTTISTWWDDQTNSIGSWWSSSWGTVATFFSNLPGQIGEALMGLPGAISGAFGRAFDSVMYGIGFALGTIVRLWDEVPDRIIGAMQDGWERLQAVIRTVLNYVMQYIIDSWNRGIDFWSTVPGRVHNFMLDLGTRVVGAVVNMFTRVMQWWDRLPGRIWTATNNAWNRAQSRFNDALHSIPGIVQNLHNRILDAIASLGGRLYNVGRDAIRGLANGIQDMLGWAVDRAWSAARSIARGFMDALHIGSPSKFMADNVGKWIPKGIMVGIEDNMGDLEKMAGMFPDMFTGSRPPLGPSVSNTDSSTNYGGINLTVRIESIQELEDIKKFLDGQMRSDPKARAWAGNLYEAQGEYVRSYQ